MMPYFEAVRGFKRDLLADALRAARGNQCKAAEMLGIHRNTMNRLISELGLRPGIIRRGVQAPQAQVNGGVR
jgi:DNA-binding NtrC family response regulator